ncbi:hypothetical protein ACSDQ9_09135 [Aestuariimicrobium soli]|uniref:hypothetical protein n=1 Tax=Aestuariimicrobium soli TaxID=2035834 RepID=UPI003EBFE5F8
MCTGDSKSEAAIDDAIKTSKRQLTEEELIAIIASCDSVGAAADTFDKDRPCEPKAATVNVPAVARQAALALTVPTPDLTIGPNPANNQWNMIPVNFPIWLQSTTPTHLTTTVTSQGITITLNAVRNHVTITTGDGTTLTCHTLPQRPTYTTDLPTSPNCGHTYRTQGDYTLTATSTWTITWTAVGQTGTITTTNTSTTHLDIGELETVLVKPPA